MPQRLLPTANKIQVLIGASETDVSIVLSSGGLIFQESEATLDGFISRTLEAEIVAKNPDYISFSLDSANVLWRQNNIVKLVIDDVVFATLRLRSFDYEINCITEEGRGQFSAECVLSRESFDRPIKPFGSTAWFVNAIRERTTATTTRLTLPWREAVDKYLGLAGLTLSNKNSLPTRLQNTYAYGGALQVAGFTAEPVDVNPNPILQANAIAIAYGYWLTTNADGDVIAVAYPTAPFVNPSLRLNRLQVRSMELERLLTGESDEPPDTVEVVGRDVDSPDQNDTETVEPDPNFPDEEPFEGQPEPCTDPGSRFTETAGGYIRTSAPATSSGIGTSNSAIFRSEKFTERGILFPALGGRGLLREYKKKQSTLYDSDGKPLSSVTRIVQPAGLASPSLFADQTYDYYSDRIEEFWIYNGDGLWIGYRKNIYRPGKIIFNNEDATGNFIIGERVTDDYIQQGCGVYAKLSATLRPRGVVNPDPDRPFDPFLVLTDNQDPQLLDALPEPPYKPLSTPIRPKVEVQDEEVIADNSDPDNPRREQVEVAHVSSPEQAKNLSRVITNIFQGRRFARIIERPLDSFTLNNYSIFAIEDVCKYRIIRDGFALAYAEDTLVVNYKGQQVGVLGSPVPVRDRPVAVPTATLTITPEPDYVLTVDEHIEIELDATGGTPPYTWSTSALPTGLTLSGNVISGSVGGVTSLTAITATVEDSLAATDNDVFNITVVSVPGAVPAYKVISRFDGSSGDSGDAFEPVSTLFDGGSGASGDLTILVSFDGSSGAGGTWLTAIAPIVYDGGSGGSGSFEFIDVLFDGGSGGSGESTIQDKDFGAFFDGGAGASGDSTIADIPGPATNGWVALYLGSVGKLAVGNVAGTSWTEVDVSLLNFGVSNSVARQNIAVGNGYVLIGGRNTSTSDPAVLRGAVTDDLTNVANWTLYSFTNASTSGGGAADKIAYCGGSVFIVDGGSGLYVTSDSGATWTKTIDVHPSSIALVAGNEVDTGWFDGNVSYNASPGDSTYTATTQNLPLFGNAARYGNGRLVVTESTTSNPEFVYSDDDGDSWTTPSVIGVNERFQDLAWVEADTWVAATDDGGIARTTDLGVWTYIALDSFRDTNGIDADGQTIIVVKDNGYYNRSTTGGTSWSSEALLVAGNTSSVLSVRKF